MLEWSHYEAQMQPVWNSLNKNETPSAAMSGHETLWKGVLRSFLEQDINIFFFLTFLQSFAFKKSKNSSIHDREEERSLIKLI